MKGGCSRGENKGVPSPPQQKAEKPTAVGAVLRRQRKRARGLEAWRLGLEQEKSPLSLTSTQQATATAVSLLGAG